MYYLKGEPKVRKNLCFLKIFYRLPINYLYQLYIHCSNQGFSSQLSYAWVVRSNPAGVHVYRDVLLFYLLNFWLNSSKFRAKNATT
jgi:hypothetical protein